MLVVHALDIAAKCPVNGRIDEYECQIRLDRLMKTEDIAEHCASYRDTAIYQEDLTQAISDHFGGEVTTKGWHGDVQTTVTCQPRRSVPRCESSSAATPGRCGSFGLASPPPSVFY